MKVTVVILISYCGHTLFSSYKLLALSVFPTTSSFLKHTGCHFPRHSVNILSTGCMAAATITAQLRSSHYAFGACYCLVTVCIIHSNWHQTCFVGVQPNMSTSTFAARLETCNVNIAENLLQVYCAIWVYVCMHLTEYTLLVD